MRTCRKRSTSRESGQGIAYVLVLTAALLVFLIAMVDMLWNESRLLNRQRRERELFHELDAVADRALYALLKEGNWDALTQGAVPGYNADVDHTDIKGIRYRLKVQEGNWTPYNPATGAVEATWTPSGDTKTERTVTIWATSTPSGDRKKLQVVYIKSTLNSALFSGGQIFVKGSADIYWGPAVSYATISDAIPLTGGSLPDHPVYLAKGGITMDGVPIGDPSLQMDSSNPKAGVYADEYSNSIGNEPVIPLELLRATAMENELPPETGDYYVYNGVASPDFVIPKSMAAGKVLFYETEDGMKWDGLDAASGNGVYVKKKGNICGSGTLVIMGDLEVVGTGSCDRYMIPPPDCYDRFDKTLAHCANPTHEPKIFWDGFMFVANELRGAGDVMVYGSIYAKSTANLNGSLKIWYKSVDNSLGTLGKTISVKLWMPRTPFANFSPGTGYVEAFPD